MASEAAESIVPQTQNLQKEPSMEEILASIRRIIEDSDQAGPPDGPANEAGASPSQPAAADDDAPADDDAVDLGDDRMAEPSWTAGQVAGGEPSAPQLDAEPADEEEQAMRAWPSAPESPTDHDTATAQDVANWSVAMETEIDRALPPSPAQADSAPPQVSAVAPERASSILSEQTSRQVAAAFGELSDAFAENRRQRFDDMAAEMMRPMLQEWLDNNLPTLVEKLVREEIERVARGG
ncbi:DUF2497 domain-containing protein [Nitratireductor sp. CAU 1489]|uniref:DUF2497 domain-containing protein n=1 Tax=Nitratireductor arenosus TaxID=2682096 RepID=A0A844QHN3_9HYPH|nr:DUF2497 domain-containing protein [Nitratireductor arenosus]MVA97461.1 DUF2497 domain-containing protein [Nitratireductor arenosus]